MSCETDVELQITTPAQKRVRLQIYDDGIGEYVYDKPVSSIAGCGHMNAVGFNRQRGIYYLPSPLSISKNGLATIQLNNIDSEGDVRAHLVLVFAVPKRDRWDEISNNGFGKETS